ncbi:MAG: group intron reverse transcriptase/maturase [Rhodospirillales bacterium]|nr:group intron reverse transcriptase/maturase [Rhodospirillales bacterium]
MPCSYAFRPGRSAHQALRNLRTDFWAKQLYWVCPPTCVRGVGMLEEALADPPDIASLMRGGDRHHCFGAVL